MGKKFGQHFLSDHTVLADIADAVFSLQQELWCDSLMEIGPGQGVLTELIIPEFDQVTLFEIDERMKPHLEPLVQRHKDAEIIWGDVLKVDEQISKWGNEKISGWVDTLMSRWGNKPLVVGNLPYYITSPIFRKFFVEQSHIWGVFLIQKEVAQKIQTITKQKSYLRWLLNYGYDIEYCFTVSATAFDPPPKVQSAVVKIQQISKWANEWMSDRPDFDRMVEFLDIVSQYSRKTLRKIWKMRTEDLAWFTFPEELEGKRLQELGWEELGQILA